MEKKKINKKVPVNTNLTAPQKVKLLFTIIERVKVDFYLDVLEGYEVNFQTVVYGRGTAPNELLGMLGITSDDKALASAFAVPLASITVPPLAPASLAADITLSEKPSFTILKITT